MYEPEQETSTKKNNKRILPVAFATDAGYSLQTFVTLYSLLEKKDEGVLADIYILIPSDFPAKEKERYEANVEGKTDCKLTFIDMGDRFKGLNTWGRQPLPTYYRLDLPWLLTQYDRCLYLDGDIIVKEDLWELFNIEMDHYLIAGVRDAGIAPREDIILSSFDQYINAGVLLMNLKGMRDTISREELHLKAKNRTRFNDQDVINSTCYDKILHLPLKYNTMVHLIKKEDVLRRIFTDQEIRQAREKPVIIHYSDRIKPWNNSDVAFFAEWWKTAVRTPYAEMLWPFIKDMSIEKIEKLQNRIIRIQKSNTYRIGEAVLWLPRKIASCTEAIRKMLPGKNKR